MILVYLIIALFAAYCAVDDLADIGSGRVIHHPVQWLIRAVVALAIVGIWWVGSEPHWTRVLFVTLACGPLFSLIFRLSLNRLRGKDWWYVSPSNLYDYLFMVLSGAAEWKPKRWGWKNYMAFLRHSHWNNMELNGNYVDGVKRAGTLATVVETVAFVVLAALAVFVH